MTTPCAESTPRCFLLWPCVRRVPHCCCLSVLQVGTVVDDPLDNNRLSKGQRRATLTEQLLVDTELTTTRKKRFNRLQVGEDGLWLLQHSTAQHIFTAQHTNKGRYLELLWPQEATSSSPNTALMEPL